MMFKDLKTGDSVFILENAGTFRKVNTYNVGTVTFIGQQYLLSSFYFSGGAEEPC